jgi:hypothetical protein
LVTPARPIQTVVKFPAGRRNGAVGIERVEANDGLELRQNAKPPWNTPAARRFAVFGLQIRPEENGP